MVPLCKGFGQIKELPTMRQVVQMMLSNVMGGGIHFENQEHFSQSVKMFTG